MVNVLSVTRYVWCAKYFRVQSTLTRNLQYIPRNMHMVFALLYFVVVIHWLIFPYPSGLLHWHCGNLTIAPVPAKQSWWIWINTSCEFIMNDCITTTKQSTTKPCAYFLGYTVSNIITDHFLALNSITFTAILTRNMGGFMVCVISPVTNPLLISIRVVPLYYCAWVSVERPDRSFVEKSIYQTSLNNVFLVHNKSIRTITRSPSKLTMSLIISIPVEGLALDEMA